MRKSTKELLKKILVNQEAMMNYFHIKVMPEMKSAGEKASAVKAAKPTAKKKSTTSKAKK